MKYSAPKFNFHDPITAAQIRHYTSVSYRGLRDEIQHWGEADRFVELERCYTPETVRKIITRSPVNVRAHITREHPTLLEFQDVNDRDIFLLAR
jgi:hypothetical protein